MKKLLLKLALFAFAVFVLLTIFLEYNGRYVDSFYGKFTVAPQRSMIFGDSKSLMGIQPSVMNRNLNGYEFPIYNYSFTVAQAPYGELYRQSIEKKLAPETKNGLFILSVSPWSISERPKDNVSKGIFSEAGWPPHNMHFASLHPNPEYVVKNFKNFHFKAVFRRVSQLHDDGWFEDSNVPTTQREKDELMRHHEEMFAKQAAEWKPSAYRLSELKKTVAMLKAHGRVILLRMPSDAAITKIEKAYWKDFDAEMRKIAAESASAYIDYTKGYQFPTYDGVHFDTKTGAEFTKSLCDSIAARNPNRK